MPDIHAYQKNVPSQMSEQDFIACFGGAYEHSPWIAEVVWNLSTDPDLAADQDTAEGIHQSFRSVVDGVDQEAKLALLRAHPDLAGRLAIARALTVASTAEQAGADLGKCTAEEFADFQRLNDSYKEKFGFPFILAVRGYQRTEILKKFKARVDNDRATEFNEALSQVHRIALLRLRDIK